MFWDTFYDLCRMKKMSPNGVAKELDLSSGSVTSWKQGKVPHYGTLLKLSDYFGVPIDYLLRSESEPNHQFLLTKEEVELVKAYRENPEMTEEEKKMHQLFQSVPKENQKELLDLIEAALKMSGLKKTEK